MKDKRNKINDTPLIFLAIPILIEMVMAYMVPFVDIYFLSQQSDLSVSAVSAVMPILLMGMSLIGAFQVGGISVCSKLVGAKKRYSLLVMQTWLVVCVACVGLLLSIFYMFSGEYLLNLMSVDPTFYAEALSYYQIWGGGIFFLGVYICFSALLIVRGEMKFIIVSGLVMNIVNVTLGYALIGGNLGFDVYQAKGAAIASVVAWVIADVIIISAALNIVGVRLSIRSIKKSGRLSLSPLLKVAIPGMIEPISYQMAQMALVIIVVAISDLSLIARAYLVNFFYITNIWNLAIASAIQTKLANSLGAGSILQAKRDVNYAIALGVGGALFISLLIFIFGEDIITIYTTDQAAIELVLALLWLNVIIDVGRSLNIVMGGVLKASGDAFIFATIGVVGTWLLAVGLGYGLAFYSGLALLGVWIASAIDENIRGALSVARWLSGAWRREIEGGVSCNRKSKALAPNALKSSSEVYAS